MESYPPPQQAAKQISPPSLLGISPPLLTLVSEWHCRARVLDAAEFRSYGHYTWEVNGVATPIPYLLSVGRVSRSFDCQLEVVPVDVDLT